MILRPANQIVFTVKFAVLLPTINHQCWCYVTCLPEEKFNTVGIHEPYTPLYTNCKQTNNLHARKQTHDDTDMTCSYLIAKLPSLSSAGIAIFFTVQYGYFCSYRRCEYLLPLALIVSALVWVYGSLGLCALNDLDADHLLAVTKNGL